VKQDRSGADSDRLLVAKLTGEARHHARWRPLTEEEEAAAVSELRTLAAGRSDLLAEVAGIFEGTSEGELDEPLARRAAQLCRKAGADEALIPQWSMKGGAGQLPPACRRSAGCSNRWRRLHFLRGRAPPGGCVAGRRADWPAASGGSSICVDGLGMSAIRGMYRDAVPPGA